MRRKEPSAASVNGLAFIRTGVLETLGARKQMCELRDRLRVGHRYMLNGPERTGRPVRARLTAKTDHFAVFEFPGVLCSYKECRGWFDLLTELREGAPQKRKRN